MFIEVHSVKDMTLHKITVNTDHIALIEPVESVRFIYSRITLIDGTRISCSEEYLTLQLAVHAVTPAQTPAS